MMRAIPVMVRRVALLLVFAAVPASAAAQSVEMVFTLGQVNQAMAIKSALKVDRMNAVCFGTLALVGASPARKKEYADKLAGVTAVVVVGEDALKAISEVEFTRPVIAINAAGPTAAKNRVIRVFDGSFAAVPAGTKVVAAPSAVPELIGTAKDVALRGDVNPVVQALLTALK